MTSGASDVMNTFGCCSGSSCGGSGTYFGGEEEPLADPPGEAALARRGGVALPELLGLLGIFLIIRSKIRSRYKQVLCI